MHLICSLAGHKVAAKTIYNAGHHFGRCDRCHVDLIEREGAWELAPRGYRVVWKTAPNGSAKSAPAVTAEAELSAANQPADELLLEQENADRRQGDRRKYKPVNLPAYLAEKDRRRRSRRQFGKRTPFTAASSGE